MAWIQFKRPHFKECEKAFVMTHNRLQIWWAWECLCPFEKIDIYCWDISSQINETHWKSILVHFRIRSSKLQIIICSIQQRIRKTITNIFSQCIKTWNYAANKTRISFACGFLWKKNEKECLTYFFLPKTLRKKCWENIFKILKSMNFCNFLLKICSK